PRLPLVFCDLHVPGEPGHAQLDDDARQLGGFATGLGIFARHGRRSGLFGIRRSGRYACPCQMRSMRHRALRCCLAVLIASRQGPLAAQSDPLRTEALQARDRADPQSLDATIRRAQAEAEHACTASAFVEVALFEDWMCEVAKVRDDGTLLRHAAEAGVSAARQAVKLAPDSSDAHWLLGDLLGQLIPLVFAGGVRHGAESTAELDR